MASCVKILVCGNVSGEFDALFKRVTSVNHKAGPFDLLLSAGQFFSDSDNSQWIPYKCGQKKVPIPTFVLGPLSEEQRKQFFESGGGFLAENVIYLGLKGIYPCSSGLRIAYCSGSKTSAPAFQYDNQKVGELELEGKSFGVTDILLTYSWPKYVTTFSSKPMDCDVNLHGCDLIARLAYNLKPRYHFAAAFPDQYYERLPYRNHQILQEDPRQCTRFIGLAGVSNKNKSKWLYAFSITPAVHCSLTELTVQPPDVTECPYNGQPLPPSYQVEKEMNKFFYDVGPPEVSSGRGKKRTADDCNTRHKKWIADLKGSCWFCLSSPEVEKHLVVSVGNHVYLALAKGGVVKQHLMLLPILHFQTSLDLEQPALEELNRFKEALRCMFSAAGQCVVFIERNYRTAHMQLHAVPLPSHMADKITHSFMSQGKKEELAMEELPRSTELVSAVRCGQPFLYVESPSGNCVLHRVKKGYDIHFDRKVLTNSSLLDQPDRIDWKTCVETPEKEEKLRDQIRQAFKPYDFTLDDSDHSSSSEDD